MRLTVDGQADGFFGAGVQLDVLCQAGVVARVLAQNLAYDEMWPGVDLGVVVEPDILTGRIGLCLTQQGNSLFLQG